MHLANRILFRLGTLALLLAALMITALAFPVLAAPAEQEAIIPTPTPYPVATYNYTLTIVGGETETLTFPNMTQDGITLSNLTAMSQYPRGMVFTLTAQSANGAIDNAQLFIELVNGSRERVSTEWDATTATWTAQVWPTGEGQPAWTPFQFIWRVRDATGVTFETAPIDAVYADPTRAWFRVEADTIIAYWFGADEIDPDVVAASVVEAMEATEPRRIAGFGGSLSYTPLAVLYPTRETLNEITGSGITSPTVGGWTSRDLGMTILHFAPRDETFTRNNDCIWLPAETGQRKSTVATRLNSTIYAGIPHEITHLYQFDYGLQAPDWWMEGEAEYFAYGSNSWPFEDRLRQLATLQDIPPLSQDSISREMIQADGCQYLNYDVGQSFVTWLIDRYGLDTHAQIVALNGSGISFTDALEEATGTSFLDLENGWRAYVGFPAVDLVDLDPALALEPYDDPQFVVGDFATLPGTPPIALLYEAPKPKALASGSCWANTQVTLLAMGQIDGTAYFQVDCLGQIGWMTRDQLVGTK
ncbi:MAG: hypothetical protein JXA10_14805 [Anaerolineae bacterium]|nr:hypothetical protein [Anaerolineae bacterium]